MKPIKSGHFSYGSDGFRADDVAPEEPQRLFELLFPNELKGKRAQKQALEDAKVI